MKILKIMNKILRTLYIVPLSFLLTGCWTTIRTVSEPVVVVRDTKPAPPTYVTTVTTPSPKVTTVTTFVATNYNTDPCFYLDLNAVGAAFAESRSTREFEQLLNSSRYMINNLDLNHDGWVDYLRVIETRQGYYHAYLIQSCIAPGLFQDVATLVAEQRANALYVEVIGDPYLYGHNYIVHPVFVRTPAMWDVYVRPNYVVWSSPYYYGNYPSYYTRPQPVYLNHYQAYVTTYLTNHHYCHTCNYPSQPAYSGYTQMTQSHRRNDYGVQHPDDSFERRVSRAASDAGKSVRNAGQLRTEVEKSSGSTTRTSGRTQQATQPTKTTESARNTDSSKSTRSSGTQTTQTTRSQSTQTKQPAQSSRTSATRTPVTTIDTRVNKSGTTRTTVRTTDSTGRTTTIKRESGSTSTRTSSSSSRTQSSSSSRTSGTTTNSSSRTSGTRSSQDSSDESSPRSSRRAR